MTASRQDKTNKQKKQIKKQKMQIKSNKTTNSLKGRKSYPRDGQTLSDRVPHKQNWRNRNQ